MRPASVWRSLLQPRAVSSVARVRGSVPIASASRQAQYSSSSEHDGEDEQVNPIGDYYELLLDQPLGQSPSTPSAPPSSTPVDPSPQSEKDLRIAKARIIFGSRLQSPGRRKAEVAAQSRIVAGVTVPPKPEEPDNCCMSGCVNCVWEIYRDELEEWAAQSKKAERALMAEKGDAEADGHTSMDDDGGGPDTNWPSQRPNESGELFKGIPVGIAEFMRTEKRLKKERAARIS